MVELTPDVRRVTFPLPTRPGHVHAYLLRERDPEGWMLVDTGLALPDLDRRLREIASGLGGPILRIAITHFHPDHVGGAEPAARLTGATVFQGVLDYEQCVHVWGNPDWPSRIAAWFIANGVPRPVADELIEVGEQFSPFIRFVRDPEPLREGDCVGGWQVLESPGHADGHLCLLRNGELVSGDHLLPDISPTVGLFPDSRPDPLGDYLDSLRRTIEVAPSIAYPGHGEPIRDPVARARELIEHHRERLEATERILTAAARPLTGYEVSLELFGGRLGPAPRRFAVAETLSHLERLVFEGKAASHSDGGHVSYTSSQVGRRTTAKSRAPVGGGS